MQQYYKLFVDINIYRGSIKIGTGTTNTRFSAASVVGKTQ